jgi:hypothetical protein
MKFRQCVHRTVGILWNSDSAYTGRLGYYEILIVRTQDGWGPMKFRQCVHRTVKILWNSDSAYTGRFGSYEIQTVRTQDGLDPMKFRQCAHRTVGILWNSDSAYKWRLGFSYNQSNIANIPARGSCSVPKWSVKLGLMFICSLLNNVDQVVTVFRRALVWILTDISRVSSLVDTNVSFQFFQVQ